MWGGWLSKKPFQKELAMHGLTFDPGQRRVLLLVIHYFSYEKMELNKINDSLQNNVLFITSYDYDKVS